MFVQNRQRILASALAGSRSALQRVANETEPELVRRHRLAPALAVRARANRLSGPTVDVWLRELRLATASWLRLQYHVEQVARTLATAGVIWIPLKGNDLGTRVYDYPEERPVCDIDILIPKEDYLKARKALEEIGWDSFWPGRLFERFTCEEFHHWAATNSAGILLELHTRLWSLIPDGLETEIIQKAYPDPSLGPAGHRVPLSYAFIVAAVQAQINPAPRPLLNWWDLARISQRADNSMAEEVIELAEKWDLQLPVALAAATAASVWCDSQCQRIADVLRRRLRFPEHLAAWWSLKGGPDALSRKGLALARLVSFRSRRGGLGVLYRRVWSHPGLVERDTPDNWPWIKRRMYHVLRNLGIGSSPNFVGTQE